MAQVRERHAPADVRRGRALVYKRGAARAALGRATAQADLEKALTVEGRSWVKGRAHLELGKLAQKNGARVAAAEHFRGAARLCESDNDLTSADEARRLSNRCPRGYSRLAAPRDAA